MILDLTLVPQLNAIHLQAPPPPSPVLLTNYVILPETMICRPESLWAELDSTGVKAVLIRFCGGQHLDHFTAYSADNVPVLELCRSDPRQVFVCRESNVTFT